MDNIEEFAERKATELTEMMYPGESKIPKAVTLKENHKIKTRNFIFELIQEWEHEQTEESND